MFIVFPKQTRNKIILKKKFSLKTLADRKLINQVQKPILSSRARVGGGGRRGRVSTCVLLKEAHRLTQHQA